jgi:phosphoglycerate kinase
MQSSEKPFTAIIGGAKVSDKILIIENLLERATDIIIGGGMANTFMKAEGGKLVIHYAKTTGWKPRGSS